MHPILDQRNLIKPHPSQIKAKSQRASTLENNSRNAIQIMSTAKKVREDKLLTKSKP